jgi:hypothetical protein
VFIGIYHAEYHLDKECWNTTIKNMNQGNFHSDFISILYGLEYLSWGHGKKFWWDDGDEDTWVCPFILLFLFLSSPKAYVIQSLTLLLAKVYLYQQSCEQNA